jgi:hypothetical protein
MCWRPVGRPLPGACDRDVAAPDAEIVAGGGVEPGPVFDDLLVQRIPLVDVGVFAARE